MVQLLSFDTAFRPASQGIFLGKRIRTSPEALDFTGVSRLVLIIGYWHTFCTNMANAGMDIKNLQYVVGHSDVGVTLNVYTHASFDRAAEQMTKILFVCHGRISPQLPK